MAAKAMESVPAGASPRAAARADSAATAKSTGPFRLLGSLLLFPFWLLWILLKGTAIIIALPFGGWRRLFKSAKSEEEDPGVVEKKLKNLSSEQQTIQTRMNKRATLWKSVSRYILMYSAIAEVRPPTQGLACSLLLVGIFHAEPQRRIPLALRLC